MTGKCTMGDNCKFAHGKEDLRILGESDKAKYKCFMKVLTRCQEKRDICM